MHIYKSVCMHTYCFNEISLDKIQQSINNSIPESDYEKGKGVNFTPFLSCKNNDFFLKLNNNRCFLSLYLVILFIIDIH